MKAQLFSSKGTLLYVALSLVVGCSSSGQSRGIEDAQPAALGNQTGNAEARPQEPKSEITDSGNGSGSAKEQGSEVIPAETGAAKPEASRPYSALEGRCLNLAEHLKGQAGLADLAGVYRKAVESDSETASGTYVQIIGLLTGHYLLVEETGSSSDQKPVSGKASFVGFLPLGEEKDGMTPYLGVVRHDEPFFGNDADGASIDRYVEHYECQFSILLKGKEGIVYSEFGVNGEQDKDWAGLHRVLMTKPPVLPQDQNKQWKKNAPAAYVRVFQNPHFRKFLTDLDMWVAIRQEDAVKIANEHYEKGLAHFKNKAFSDAYKEFNEGLRLTPGNAQGYLMRSAAHFALNRYEHGARDVTKALALDRDIGRSPVASIARDGLLIRGKMQEKAGQDNEAFNTYHEATKLLPDDGKAESSLVFLSARTGAGRGNAKAHNACEHIKSMKPEWASCHDVLSQGWFPQARGQARIETQSITFENIVAGIVVAIGAIAVIEASHGGSASTGGSIAPNTPNPIPNKPWVDVARCVNKSKGIGAAGCF